MSLERSRADAPQYPVVSALEAKNRADQVVTRIELDTDVGLEDRLETELGVWMDTIASGCLAHEVKHLYWLSTDPSRTQADKPVDASALRRSLFLAMSRPGDDDCWRDYLEIQEAIYQRWLAVGALLRARGVWQRLLRRNRLSDEDIRLREREWQGPITEARAHFIARWRG